MKQIIPGVYGADPAYTGDDLERLETLVRICRMPANSRSTHRLHKFEEVPGRKEGLQAAIDFINGRIDPPLLLLYGEPGRSKTFLALAIGWVFISRLSSVLYYEVADLLDALRNGYRLEEQVGNFNVNSFSSLMNQLKSYELLILDDLGEEKPTDWAIERLDLIINFRYINRKPTVITTNTLDISDRILDRCREGWVARLQGASFRAIIQKRKNK